MRLNDKMVKVICAILAVAICLPIVFGAIAMFN